MGRETQFKFLGNRFEFKHLPGFSAPFGLRGFPQKKVWMVVQSLPYKLYIKVKKY